MLVTFIGAQSTGKTTLFNELLKNKNLTDVFTFVTETTRTVQKSGLKINEDGDMHTQEAIMKMHEENIKLPNAFLDRSAVDCYVYSLYLAETGKLTSDDVAKLHFQFKDLLPSYDVIFYIEPEFSIVDDGVRSVNTSFRDRVASLFKDVIKDYNIEIVKLSGTVEQRMQTIYNTLRERGISC